MYKSLLLCALFFATFFSHAQSVSLISDVRYEYGNGNFHSIDSGTYYYDFGRSALPDNSAQFGGQGWACDSMVRHTFSGGQPANTYRYAYSFDNSSRLTKAQFTNASGTPISRATYHYGNSGLDTSLSESIINGVWTPASRTSYIYGQDGVASILREKWNNTLSVFENDERVTNTYTSGLLTQEMTEEWDGAAWQPLAQSDYTYAGDDITMMIYEDFSGTGPANKWKWEYSYDVNNDRVMTMSYIWDSGPGTWDTSSRKLYTYDNAHNLLTTINQYYLFYDFVNTMFEINTYNSYNLIETYERRSNWDGIQFLPEDFDPRRVYHYEEFDPTSVFNTVGSNTQLQVFPNPASHTLSIRSFATQSEPFSVTIFDATGRSVKHWNEPPSTFYQKQVDISQLPSGTYFLRIDNKPQEAVQFTVIK